MQTKHPFSWCQATPEKVAVGFIPLIKSPPCSPPAALHPPLTRKHMGEIHADISQWFKMHVRVERKRKGTFFIYLYNSIEASKGNCFVLGRSPEEMQRKKRAQKFQTLCMDVLSTYPPARRPAGSWYLKFERKKPWRLTLTMLITNVCSSFSRLEINYMDFPEPIVT